ncbi:MAG: carboxypeptidase regulatory-like domain-containing protein [Bryobacteraceae bacterium]
MKALRCPFALFLSAAAAFAQVDRATLTGVVRDSSGSVVTDAVLTVTHPATGLTRKAESNHSGVYFITGLPIGKVEVAAEKAGFQKVRNETRLAVGETRTLNFDLTLASVETSVYVVADAGLVQNTAAYATAFQNSQISRLPVNGRNWGNLMTLAPGAVDTGAGNGSSVRFFGRGGDDNNFRVDGVDATSVRNQTQSKSRLLISTDAISEFRVSSSLYTAESGGAPGGQIEIVSKTGSNELHGGLFEYFRNSALDARTPFDGARIPPFRLNQFGASAGGPIKRDRTFLFASYEGYAQRQGRTQIGFVPSDLFRSRAAASVKPIIDLYPAGQTPVSNNANVMQWTGVASATQDEHVGLIRADHRFNDKLTGYFRFTKNSTDAFAPNAALPVGTRNLDAPTNGLFDLLYLVNPRTTNELRIGANYSEPLNSISKSGIDIAVAVPSLSTIPADTRRIAFGISQSLIDQWSTLRGAHAIKAGVEIKRVQLIIHDWANAQAGTLTYANLADFQANRLTTVEYSGELPTKQMRKMEYFGYVQDEWKIRPNVTANLGLRYEFYNVFHERFGRAIPFDIQTCGGYCPAGSDFAFPDTNNFAPRVSIAWAPRALHDRTVIRAGGGIFYGDAQLGDAYSPANNDAQRFTLSAADKPGLAFPINSYLNPNAALATAPRSMPRNKRNQVSQQWGLSVQHAISSRASFMIGYNGQQNYHVFNRTYVNVINPLTGKRQLPALDQIDVRGEDGVSSFHGMVSSFQLDAWRGLVLRANYMFAHAINDGSSGGGGADNNGTQNVACRSCDKASSSIDARHVFTSSFAYDIPWGRNRWFGGWQWSGIATSRTGLPVNVSVTRRATDVLDGNTLSSQRPDLVPGVPLYLDYAATGRWLNPAAFAVPAAGKWGNLGRNVVRAPGLFQIDLGLVKRTNVTERFAVEFGAQAFNIMNHPQLAAPAANISSSANFGRITAPINTSPTGAGTPRQFQLMLRTTF